MKNVKTFEDFLGNDKEPEKLISERLLKKLKECWEMVKNEMKTCHEDESEMTAEKWLGEYMKCNESFAKDCMKECEGIMAKPSKYGTA